MITVILVAAGSGTRLGSGIKKQFLPLHGKEVFEYSLETLTGIDEVDEVILVVPPEEKKRLSEKKYPKAIKVVVGGSTRAESVKSGFLRTSPHDLVLVHDAARPLVHKEDILKVIEDAKSCRAAVLGFSAKDTMKKKMKNGRLLTLDRNCLYAVQTPQVFDWQLFKESWEFAKETDTDDSQRLERMGVAVHITEGSADNFKITTKSDFNYAQYLLQQKDDFRIGHGYDVHPLIRGKKLILCGVNIPHTFGLQGHSDADVAVHAVIDAILGALALGDIGMHFPDTDIKYKGAYSLILLEKTAEFLKKEQYLIGNLDITILAQAPKLSPYIFAMRENIAKTLAIDLNRVSVKATTEEGLGFTGRKEGIAAHGIVLLKKNLNAWF